MDGQGVARLGSVAAVAAVVGVLSSLLTLYSQASTIVETQWLSFKASNTIPIGTVVASMLREDQLAKSLHENSGNSSDKITWVLADGRDVHGTTYALSGFGNNVPDLRGLFLRAIDKAGSTKPGDFQEQSTARPNVPFSGIVEATKVRGLVASENNHAIQSGGPFSGFDIVEGEIPARNFSVAEGGDPETRPRNASVYYYIKIN